MQGKKLKIWHIAFICVLSLIPLLGCLAYLAYQDRKFIAATQTSLSEYFIRTIDSTITEAQVSAVGFDSVASYAKLSESTANKIPDQLCSSEMRRKLETINRQVQYIQHVNIVNEKRELICGEPYNDIQPIFKPIDLGSNSTTLTPAITNIQDKLYFILSVKLNNNIYCESYIVLDKRNVLNQPSALFALKDVSLIDHNGDRLFLDDRWNVIYKNYSENVQYNTVQNMMLSKSFPYGIKMKMAKENITSIFNNHYNILLFFSSLLSAIFAIGVYFYLKIKPNVQNLVLPMVVDTEIRNAVLNQEFIPYYQPIVSLETGDILGCEVLMRWRKPTGRVILPLSFIERVQNDEFAGMITQQIMETAVIDLGLIISKHKNFNVSFNLFSIEFKDKALAASIRNIFLNSSIPPENIILELTEHKTLPDTAIALDIINEMRGAGFKIALDDVGIGASNLVILQTLPVDFVKLDKQFIDKIQKNNSAPIIEGIVEIAKGMNIKIIAEGIETQHQYNYLRGLKVYAGQGFAISPPLPAEEFLKFIEQVNLVESAVENKPKKAKG